MKSYTLLEIVQEVGRLIGSDEVTEIDESIETIDIAALAVSTLADILGRDNWEFMADRMVVLTGSADNLKYTLPESVLEVQGVFYGSADGPANQVAYAMPQFFLRRAGLNVSGTVVPLPGGGSVKLLPTGNPARYTSFDERSIILFNNVGTNTITVRARVAFDMTPSVSFSTVYEPTWVPDIPLKMFNVWLYETAALAASELRQSPSARLEGMAQRAYQALRLTEPVTRLETAQRNLSLGMDARIGTIPAPPQQGGSQ